MDPVIVQAAASLGFAVRVATALILASAGVAKLRTWSSFRAVLADYRILPVAAVPIGAALLPPVEILLGILLVIDQDDRSPVLLSAALLLLFAGAIGINLRRGRRKIECGCSLGDEGQPIRPAMVVRNLLIAAALIMASAASSSNSALVVAAAAVSGMLFFLLYCVLNQVLALGGRLATRDRIQ